MKKVTTHCARDHDSTALCGLPFPRYRISILTDLSQVTCLSCRNAIDKISKQIRRDLESEIAELQKALQDDVSDMILHNVDRALEGRQGFARGG